MTKYAPIPDYEAAREAMIDSQLRPQGVNDPAVLRAMMAVPRERFVPEKARPSAYIDRCTPLGGGRMLSPASSIGLLLTQIAPERGEKALIVGSATGYSAAVLKHIGLEVIALESSPDLARSARDNGIETVEGPLEQGWKRGAPYDLILVDGAVDALPKTLINQLADGGRLGAGIADGGIARLIAGRKAAGGFGQFSIADAAMPRLPGFDRPKAFQF